MEINILSQGYNLEVGTSGAATLINALADHRYSSFKCLVAFASYSAVTAFAPHIQSAKDRGCDIQFIVGVDQQGTSKEALEGIIGWNINAFVYYSTSLNIFHPKIYIFEGPQDYLLIVGSNNFTEMGLVKNIECSMMLTHHKVDATDREPLVQIETYFRPYFNQTDPNLQSLSPELANQLFASGIIASEHTRDKQHDRKGTSNNRNRAILPFGKTPIQPNPIGFKPKRVARIEQLQRQIQNQVERETFNDDNNWIPTPSNNVLIAEIGGPERWKQVNFPLRLFREFFGATPQDNTYHINLIHTTNTGDQEDIESRQAVSVASHNYRFEIGAAKGRYPIGDSRPIGIFIRVARKNFIYRLFMPTDLCYAGIKQYLYDQYNGPTRNLKRIVKEYQNLPPNLHLPF